MKCYYCDFTAFSGQGSAADRYVGAVLREADLYPGICVDTLYMGGGTPTELSAAQLSRLLEGLAGRFGPLSALRESTVEASPESADAARLDALAAAGVSRVSFGLQTASDRLLKAIGRGHTFAEFRAVFAAARARGFALSIDLMQGLPGQSKEDARTDLEAVLSLEPDHLSLYTLQVEDRTLFGKREVEVDPDMARETMEAALKRLREAGFVHYEISNFARPGRESIHNTGYWVGRPGLGLGCGAAGFLGGVRTQNEDRLPAYLDRVARGERPVKHAERLEGREKLGEEMMLRLRLISGLVPTPEMRAAFRPQIDRLLAAGLLVSGVEKFDAMRLSGAGLFVANEVFREFVPPWEIT